MGIVEPWCVDEVVDHTVDLERIRGIVVELTHVVVICVVFGVCVSLGNLEGSSRNCDLEVRPFEVVRDGVDECGFPRSIFA